MWCEQSHLDQRRAVALSCFLGCRKRFPQLLIGEMTGSHQHLAEEFTDHVRTDEDRIAVANINDLFKFVVLDMQQTRGP